MGQIILNVKSLTGPIAGAKAIFDLGQNGTSTKAADDNGTISISGLSIGDYTAVVSADGFTNGNASITLSSEQDIQTQNIVLQSDVTVDEAKQDVISNVVAAVTPVAEKVVNAVTDASTTSTDPATAYSNVKADYSSIITAIDSQKSAITAALKVGAVEIIEAEGAKLNINVTQKLNDSMHWYVTERSKIPSDSQGIPTGWDNLILWGKYTSMIAGISIARKKGVSFLADVCTKLMNL